MTGFHESKDFRSKPVGIICRDMIAVETQCIVSHWCLDYEAECSVVYLNTQAVWADRLPPFSGRRSETFEGVLEFAVNDVGVDLGCGEVLVAEGTLYNEDVAGSAVEVGCEGVPETVRAELLVDASSFEPILEPPGDLPFAESLTAIGQEQCRAFLVTPVPALCQVGSKEGA